MPISCTRPLKLFLVLSPMNQLDAAAPPIDIFRDQADARPYQAVMPEVALDNLVVPPAGDARTAFWMKRTREQNFLKPDQADADALNRVIWFSVRGDTYPEHLIAHLPAFDLMQVGLRQEANEDGDEMAERAGRRCAHRPFAPGRGD